MTATNQSYGPLYYNRGKIEVWDFIRDQGLPYHLGNAVKYICRTGYKDDPIADLKKAIHYLENELYHAERKDLSRHNTEDSIVFGGSGIPGGVSPDTITFSASSYQAAEPYNGGVQGIFGGGTDVLSFESFEQSEHPERIG